MTCSIGSSPSRPAGSGGISEVGEVSENPTPPAEVAFPVHTDSFPVQYRNFMVGAANDENCGRSRIFTDFTDFTYSWGVIASGPVFLTNRCNSFTMLGPRLTWAALLGSAEAQKLMPNCYEFLNVSPFARR
jgi:hypothetical protein